MESIIAPLRPTLQSLTHNLPAPLVQTSISLLGAQCHKTLIHDIIPDPTCMKLAISKALGLGIIGASSVVKIPQLLNIIRSKSAAGISFEAYILEIAAYMIGLAYNSRMGFPFSTYGETALITAQNVVIAALVLQFTGRGAAVPVFVAGLGVVGYSLFSESIVGMGLLSQLMAGAGVLGVASKLPQIWTIYQQGGTGQLSAFAVFNYLVGSLTRIFTTLQEVPDNLVLYGFIAGFILNAVIALQMVYYLGGSKETTTVHSKTKKKVTMSVPHDTPAKTSSAQTVQSPTTRRRG